MSDCKDDFLCLSRRGFLFAGASTMILSSIPGFAADVALQKQMMDRKKIGSLSQLKIDEPVEFRYPSAEKSFSHQLIKLGVSAGGGVGAEQDIVAFSLFCPHMGGPLHGTYKGHHKVMGPCPMHLTTFDLTRHGMLVSGHATQSLPQVILEVEGDDIFAVGIMGLIYGRHNNFAQA